MKLLASFFEEGFAAVTPDNRLKTWDSATGSLRRQLVHPQHLAVQYTALATGSVPPSSDSNASPAGGRKRKSRKASKVLAALGTEKGVILVWDLSKGELVAKLGDRGDGHALRVTGLAFSSDGRTLYSGSADKSVIAWTLDLNTTGSARHAMSAKWKADKHALHALALSPDDTHLAVASSTIKLFDIATRSVVARFAGHPVPVNQMVFSPDGTALASSAMGDRFINIWNPSDASVPPTVLAAEATPVRLAFAPSANHGLTASSHTLLAVLETGASAALWSWSRSSPSTSQGSLPPVSSVAFAPSAPKPHSKQQQQQHNHQPSQQDSSSSDSPIITPILSASFSSPLTVIVAGGNIVKPAFSSRKIADSSAFLTQVLLDPPGGRILHMEGADSTSASPTTKPSRPPPSLGPSDMAGSMPLPAPASRSAPTSQDPLEGLTLQQRLDALSLGSASNSVSATSSTASPTSNGVPHDLAATGSDSVPGSEAAEAAARQSMATGAPPKAESLQSVLVQALHSKDNALLEYCLSVSDEKVIHGTVSRLPTAYVMPFLTTLIEKMSVKPSRGMALMTWIRSVLITHAGYLMTVPDLVKTLSGLYQTVDSRLAVFKRLLKLSGRLDLVLSQITARTAAAAASTSRDSGATALAVYDENDEVMGDSDDSDDDSDDSDEHGSDESDSDASDSDASVIGGEEEVAAALKARAKRKAAKAAKAAANGKRKRKHSDSEDSDSSSDGHGDEGSSSDEGDGADSDDSEDDEAAIHDADMVDAQGGDDSSEDESSDEEDSD